MGVGIAHSITNQAHRTTNQAPQLLVPLHLHTPQPGHHILLPLPRTLQPHHHGLPPRHHTPQPHLLILPTHRYDGWMKQVDQI